MRYCECYPLPTTPATVTCYLGAIYASGRVRGGSIRPYIAAIGSQHRRCGFSDPTKDPLVRAARQGYRSSDLARAGGPPTRSAPLPARCALRALQSALDSRSPERLQYWGLMALGFLLCSRPTSVRLLECEDVDIRSDCVTLQMRQFKGGESGSIPRIAVRIPTPMNPTPDPISLLFRRLLEASSPNEPRLFPQATAGTMASGLSELVSREVPPRGTSYTPRSLRSGGMSAANAIGVPLPSIMRLSHHTCTQTVHRHYLDALLPACSAGRIFFQRFLPTTAVTRPGGSS